LAAAGYPGRRTQWRGHEWRGPNSVITSSNWAGIAPSTFNLVLTDATKGWTQRVSGTLSNPALSSAEVIAEAPCCTAATADGKSLSTYNPTEIVMPSTWVPAMDSTGNFTVSYTGFPGFPVSPGSATVRLLTEPFGF
jgi:hypothetical protein